MGSLWNVDDTGVVTLANNATAGGYRITNLGTPSLGTDAANKTYVDNVVTGLTWKSPVQVRNLVGNAAPTYINALVYPGLLIGDAYVITTAGAITLGSLSVNPGDLIEYNGSIWVTIDIGHGGFVDDDIRAILSNGPTHTPLISPYTEGTDNAKIVSFSGSSNTGINTGDAATSASVLVVANTDPSEQPSYYEDTAWVFEGTIPAGYWIQFNGAGQITPGNGILKSGNTISASVDNSTINFNGSGQIEVEIGGITNTQVSATAAIAGTKISPNFGAQSLVATGTASLLGSGSSAASALLTLNSATQGFLPPQMTSTQMYAIVSPAAGLLVYNSTVESYFYYAGSSWINVTALLSVEYEGSLVPTEPTLNFLGPGIVVTDDPINHATDIYFSGNGSQPIREDFIAGTAVNNYTGSLTVITTVNEFPVGSEAVYRDGLLQKGGSSTDPTVCDYYITGTYTNTFTFNTALDINDKVSIVEVKPLLTGNTPFVEVIPVTTPGQTIFPVSQTFVVGQERVYVNGLRKLIDNLDGSGTNDYTVSSNNIILHAGRNIGDNVVVEVLAALPTLSSLMPQWQTYTVSYSSFTSGASQSITLFSLPAGAVIHNVIIAHTASFSGGSISAYTLSAGILGSTTKYASAFDVHQAPGGNVGQISNYVDYENSGSATNILVTATSTGGNLSTATTGSALVKVLVSQAF